MASTLNVVPRLSSVLGKVGFKESTFIIVGTPSMNNKTTSKYFNGVFKPIQHIITHEFLGSNNSTYKDYSLLGCHVT
jgi:hypothetical protein